MKSLSLSHRVSFKGSTGRDGSWPVLWCFAIVSRRLPASARCRGTSRQGDAGPDDRNPRRALVLIALGRASFGDNPITRLGSFSPRAGPRARRAEPAGADAEPRRPLGARPRWAAWEPHVAPSESHPHNPSRPSATFARPTTGRARGDCGAGTRPGRPIALTHPAVPT